MYINGIVSLKMKHRIRIFSTISIAVLLMTINFSSNCDAQKIQDSVKDADGNVYKIVKIGTQLWFAENLYTARYNDSTEIPLVIDGTIWDELTTPAYCWYNNEPVNKSVYGALYNWYAVNTNKLCPFGWHVPTKDEWMTLVGYVNNDGGKLKEVGPTLFKNPKYNPNIGATNESGFAGRLGGERSIHGIYYSNGQSGFWWTSSEYSESTLFSEWKFNDAFAFALGLKSSGYGFYHNNKLTGYSIRCIKDY
jgi:uncharacterized protein (TIGR02145 family)